MIFSHFPLEKEGINARVRRCTIKAIHLNSDVKPSSDHNVILINSNNND